MIKIKTIISKMRPIGHIGLMRHMGLMSLISLMTLFVSCSGSDDFGEQGGGAAGFVLGGVSGYSSYFEESRDIQMTRSGEGQTRAWTIPSGYVPYENGAQSIAIAFTKDGINPKETPDPEDPEKTKSMVGNFFKIGDEWRTNLKIETSKTYYLYGFIPDHPDIKYNITDLHPDVDDDTNGETATAHDGYSAGAIMTLQDVPTVMPNDFCVVIGAKHGTDKEHDSGLRMGDFSFTSSQGSESKDFVFLLFDHIYSSIDVRLKVYGDYAELRKIKLKSLKLCPKYPVEEDEEIKQYKIKEYNDITINVHATDGSNPKESPISEPTFTQKGEVISDEGVEYWSDAAGQELTTIFQSFAGYFMPMGVTNLVLTSVYDVYDLKGNLVRKGCKATNNMVLSDLTTGQTTTERGKRYSIDMTIMPTYLYVLSEPDVKNPVVINDN